MQSTRYDSQPILHKNKDLDSDSLLQCELRTVRQHSGEQKQDAVRLMGRMIVVDEEIHYNEVRLYNAVCKTCGIAGVY